MTAPSQQIKARDRVPGAIILRVSCAALAAKAILVEAVLEWLSDAGIPPADFAAEKPDLVRAMFVSQARAALELARRVQKTLQLLKVPSRPSG